MHDPIFRPPFRIRWLTLALTGTFAAVGTAEGADTATSPLAPTDIELSNNVQPLCPVGVLKCPKKTDVFVLCKRNSLLDFFTPGLPPKGERNKSVSDMFADKVSSPDGTNYTLEGNAELQRLDALLKSDYLTFNSETTDYNAQGHVRYQDYSMLLAADHATGTGTPQTTKLENVRYQMLAQRGNGVAQSAVILDPDHATAHEATYSTCDPDDRQWEIRGRDMETDQIAQEAYVHDAVMYYHGVPFFWFPYMKVPLNNERESGFLFPSIGYTERHGFVLGLPYYLNLAPNYDATLEPKEMTKRGPMLGGQFRYIDDHSHLQIDFNEVPHDQQVADARDAAQGNSTLLAAVPSEQRNFIRIQDTTSFTANWGMAIGINHVSDPDYLHDYGESLITSATSLLMSSAYLNGRGAWWSASFGADKWEISDPSLTPAFEPYERLPHATFTAEHPVLGNLAVGINSEYSDFKKSDAVTGSRVDLYPYLSYPIETAAFFLRPELGWRYTSYDLDDLNFARDINGNPLSLTDRTPSRSVSIFSVDTGLFFERDVNWFGSSFTQTLEPRLFYLNVPYRNQTNLPILDTQLPSFDFPSLFRTNAFVGADRQINADSLTAAITTRLLDSGGDQILSASLGKIKNFTTIHLQFPGYNEVAFTGEDYVGELNLRLDDHWSLNWDQQWNPNTHQTDLSSIGVERRFGREGLLNVSYTFRRGFLEQVDATTLIPLNENWSAIGRYYYSLMDRRLLETFVGVEYDSCCVAMRAMVRHYVNLVSYLPNEKADTGLYFEVEFNGLGGTGKRTENYLRRAMLGYP